jgi:hypothetical protein
MRRSSTLAVLAAVLATSCTPPTTGVSVDMNRVLQETEVRGPSKPKPPSPPPAEPALTSTIPGKAAMVIKDRPGASGQEIRERIRVAQAQALKDITQRLRRFYSTEVARFELEQGKLRTVAEMEAYENASARIRQRFDLYAEQREPVFTQPPDNPLPPALQKRFEEAKELRARLEEIDREFRADVDQILSSIQDVVAAQLAAMRLRIEQFKDELDRKAAEEANAQVRETAKELGLELIQPRNLTLPAAPAQSVSILGGPAFRPAPEVPSAGILTGKADRERLLRHELDVWLGLNRYTLVNGGKDVTGDFLKWREKFEVGH